jgi:anti-sigma B factor antagonist
MPISVDRQRDVTRVVVGPQLGVANRQEFKDLVLTELTHGARKLLIDFGPTTYIDSSGLGVLVSVSKKVRELQGELRLLNLGEELRALFRLTLLDKMFQFDMDTPPGGEATAGSRVPLKPRPGPVHGTAQADFPPPDEATPP